MRRFSQDDIPYSKLKRTKQHGLLIKQNWLLDLIQENKADTSRTEFS